MFVCEYFQLGLISIVSFGVWLAGWDIIIFLVTFLLLQILATSSVKQIISNTLDQTGQDDKMTEDFCVL